ncbi:hypothetical protein BsWGS_07393 [Bradybaena similaris]
MAAERLTQTALEQHDELLAKLHISPDTSIRQRKESLTAAQTQKHLFNRRESTRRISNAIYEPTSRESTRRISNAIYEPTSREPTRRISYTIYEPTSRESTRRISNAIYEPTSGQPERKSSRSFLGTSSQSDGALSVFRVIQAARTWKRFSHRHHAIQEKPKRRLQNTYRLGPDPENVFSPAKVKVAIEEVLNRRLQNFRYSSDDSKNKCLLISSEILSLVKEMDFRRYKIVCNVTIMQNKDQGSEMASRCVWDSQVDSTASLTHTTGDVVCVASVHAVYFE